jgi:oleate hydratase
VCEPLPLAGRSFFDNLPGDRGLIIVRAFKWLASSVIPHQPDLIDQPDDASVFWGYGLFVDKPANFVMPS